jgi:hypothetical protein
MNVEEAKRAIGQEVFSYDAGEKMIKRVYKAHGPYTLLQVTKGGLAILLGREEERIPLSLLVMNEGGK